MDPFRAPVEKKVQSKSVEHWKRLTARVYAETLHELCIQIEFGLFGVVEMLKKLQQTLEPLVAALVAEKSHARWKSLPVELPIAH